MLPRLLSFSSLFFISFIYLFIYFIYFIFKHTMVKQSLKYATILLSHQKTGIKAKLLSKISMCCFIARIQLTVF